MIYIMCLTNMIIIKLDSFIITCTNYYKLYVIVFLQLDLEPTVIRMQRNNLMKLIQNSKQNKTVDKIAGCELQEEFRGLLIRPTISLKQIRPLPKVQYNKKRLFPRMQRKLTNLGTTKFVLTNQNAKNSPKNCRFALGFVCVVL